MSSNLRDLGQRVTGANNMFTSLTAKLLAFGGGAAGVYAVGRAMRGVGEMAFQANAEFETARLSLAAVYNSVEGIGNLQTSLNNVERIFNKINLAAAATPATATELVGIYNQIYGPLRTAGATQEQLLMLTQDTSAAALALGVSTDMAGSSIARMVQGSAGLDNPLFRALHSMGLITETAAQFNRLAPDEAFHKVADALHEVGGEAAAEFGNTWVGISSTFGGMIEYFARIFGSATFERIKNALKSVNEQLGENRQRIEAFLTVMGTQVGNFFSRMISRIQSTGQALVANLDVFAARVDQAINTFMRLRPVLIDATRAFVAIQAGRAVIGGALSAASVIAGAMSFLPAAAGAISAAAGAMSGALAGGAMATGGIFSGALLALQAAITPLIAPFAALAGVVVALWEGFRMFGDTLSSMFLPLQQTFTDIGGDLMEFFMGVYELLAPLLGMLGGILGGVVITAFRILGGILRLVTGLLRLLGAGLRYVGQALRPFFQWLGEKILGVIDDFGTLGDALNDFVNWIRSFFNEEGEAGPTARPATEGLNRLRNSFNAPPPTNGAPEGAAEGGGGIGGSPRGRGGTHIDMRGSTINQRFDLRGENPDNVMFTVREAFEEAAFTPMQSGLANPLTQ